MAVCNGDGDNPGHCCWIDGEVCEFLFVNRGGVPRCSVWDIFGKRATDLEEWQAAPVGQWFAKNHPGYTCPDWPQNLPEYADYLKPESKVGLCCYESERMTV